MDLFPTWDISQGFLWRNNYCVGWGAHSAMFCMLMSLLKKAGSRRPKPNNFLFNCIFLEMKRSAFRHGILSNRALDLIGNVLNNCHIFYHHGPGTGSEYIKTSGGFNYYCSSWALVFCLKLIKCFTHSGRFLSWQRHIQQFHFQPDGLSNILREVFHCVNQRVLNDL
jgi:hypothetical protein